MRRSEGPDAFAPLPTFLPQATRGMPLMQDRIDDQRSHLNTGGWLANHADRYRATDLIEQISHPSITNKVTPERLGVSGGNILFYEHFLARRDEHLLRLVGYNGTSAGGVYSVSS